MHKTRKSIQYYNNVDTRESYCMSLTGPSTVCSVLRVWSGGALWAVNSFIHSLLYRTVCSVYISVSVQQRVRPMRTVTV